MGYSQSVEQLHLQSTHQCYLNLVPCLDTTRGKSTHNKVTTIVSLAAIEVYNACEWYHITRNFCGQNFLQFKPIFVIHHHFILLQLSSPVLKTAARKLCDENFHKFCVIHKNHKNIWPQKFGAIWHT